MDPNTKAACLNIMMHWYVAFQAKKLQQTPLIESDEDILALSSLICPTKDIIEQRIRKPKMNPKQLEILRLANGRFLNWRPNVEDPSPMTLSYVLEYGENLKVAASREVGNTHKVASKKIEASKKLFFIRIAAVLE